MDEADIVLAVRRLAFDLRSLVPGTLDQSQAFKLLQSVPGKGSPLVQWFNREKDARRKRVISDVMGHMARCSYQQNAEFYKSAADELEKLCDQLSAVPD
ncbi:MAG: hypothetical protein IT423_00670 [Pirellulaceae bacterium]|nr:hypothetical protein [Pirellulaceae bacterium]